MHFSSLLGNSAVHWKLLVRFWVCDSVLYNRFTKYKPEVNFWKNALQLPQQQASSVFLSNAEMNAQLQASSLFSNSQLNPQEHFRPELRFKFLTTGYYSSEMYSRIYIWITYKRLKVKWIPNYVQEVHFRMHDSNIKYIKYLRLFTVWNPSYHPQQKYDEAQVRLFK